MHTSSARTSRLPTARRTPLTSRVKTWGPWSTSITGGRETCLNLPNALIARKPVGHRSVWRVSMNHVSRNFKWNIWKNFSGYRCEWCGFTSHGGCRHFVTQECTFGILQPIYLPPHAVSIPRTEVPMEAIIGVQVKTKGAPMTREYSCRKFWAFDALFVQWECLIVRVKLSQTVKQLISFLV